MRIAISGSSGLIGKTLKNHFQAQGHEVLEIVRHKPLFNKKNFIHLDLKHGTVDSAALENLDILIHLAGSNIADRRWTEAYKQEILDSRIKSTKILVHAIKELNKRPKTFFCASAIGFYGNQPESIQVDERSNNGHGFLAQVCQEWENASADAILYGVRLIHTRFGIVLSKKGGALAKMLPVFYFGLGGKLGNGKQKMSWVALDEVPCMFDHVIAHEEINGPVNIVSPNPVTNREFTRILGKVLFRPTIMLVPGFMIKLLMGQMGKELLLEGAHVNPAALSKTGYKFIYPDLEGALRKVLK